MKTAKRVLILILSVSLLLGLAFCTSQTSQTSQAMTCVYAKDIVAPATTVKLASVKGLSALQEKIGRQIIGIGISRGRPIRDIKVALMTAMQESGMRNLAYGHLDSLGIYQQRRGWGTAKQRLDPVYAINKFYAALEKVKNRDKMPLMEVAIAVQRPSRAAYTSRGNNFNSWNKIADSLLTGQSSGTVKSRAMVYDYECEPQDAHEELVEVPRSSTALCPSGGYARQLRLASGRHIKVCRVNGMTVNVKIAHKWAYLVKEARKDGINLTGGGFRTAAQQIKLRRDHCGTSHYAIYEMPASQCTPDTARPGRSNHETATAVDLHNASSYGSRVYNWMKKHAPPIGIHARVPGEPWHWSPSGG